MAFLPALIASMDVQVSIFNDLFVTKRKRFGTVAHLTDEPGPLVPTLYVNLSQVGAQYTTKSPFYKWAARFFEQQPSPVELLMIPVPRTEGFPSTDWSQALVDHIETFGSDFYFLTASTSNPQDTYEIGLWAAATGGLGGVINFQPNYAGTPGAATFGQDKDYAVVESRFCSDAGDYTCFRIEKHVIAGKKASSTKGVGSHQITLTYDNVGVIGNSKKWNVVKPDGNDVAMSAALNGDEVTVTLGTNSSGGVSDAKNTVALVATEINKLVGFTATYKGFGAGAVAAFQPIQAKHTAGIGSGKLVVIAKSAVGSDGNEVQVAVVAGSGNNSALTVGYANSLLTITLGTDGGGALDPTKNTAKKIADLINGEVGDDFIAEYGAVGDVSIAPFVAVHLSGGKDALTSLTGGVDATSANVDLDIEVEAVMVEGETPGTFRDTGGWRIIVRPATDEDGEIVSTLSDVSVRFNTDPDCSHLVRSYLGPDATSTALVTETDGDVFLVGSGLTPDTPILLKERADLMVSNRVAMAGHCKPVDFFSSAGNLNAVVAGYYPDAAMAAVGVVRNPGSYTFKNRIPQGMADPTSVALFGDDAYDATDMMILREGRVNVMGWVNPAGLSNITDDFATSMMFLDIQMAIDVETAWQTEDCYDLLSQPDGGRGKVPFYDDGFSSIQNRIWGDLRRGMQPEWNFIAYDPLTGEPAARIRAPRYIDLLRNDKTLIKKRHYPLVWEATFKGAVHEIEVTGYLTAEFIPSSLTAFQVL